VPFYYLGADRAKALDGGYVSVGDMGAVDADGYLYLADRRMDMIVSGGENVYPTQVEGVMSEHRGIADVAVLGLPDEEWGQRVHAVIAPRDFADHPSVPEIREFLAGRLAHERIPKTYEFVAALPRDEAGKLRRSALRNARLPTRS
jgi:bile acid-coenzyme A ligase